MTAYFGMGVSFAGGGTFWQEERRGGGADLVDVAEHGLFHRLVLDDFAQDAAVAAADYEDFLGVGV